MAIAITVILTGAAVVAGVRILAGSASTRPNPPTGTLDARSPGVTPSPSPSGFDAEPATRLTLLGPLPLVDTRQARPLAAGATISVPLPNLPQGSTALLVGVSVLQAGGPGAVTLTSGEAETTVLQVPRAKVMRSVTAIVPIGADGVLRATTRGGGDLVVTLVGAFEPVRSATAGRVIAVPATEVVHLVPARDGKDAAVAVADVPVLARQGSVAAVLLQVSADVGTHGGLVSTGATAGRLDQTFMWVPTSGRDRVRAAFLVVPVVDGAFALHYQAGRELRAAVVGYVTDATAPQSTAGLVVPARPDPTTHQVAAGGDVTAARTPVDGRGADRVAAVWLGVSATTTARGSLTAGQLASGPPTLSLTPAAPQQTVTLVAAPGGAVRLRSDVAATVTLAPQAYTLAE
jgi:hypothetical protein